MTEQKPSPSERTSPEEHLPEGPQKPLLSANYWSSRYREQQTGWDLGHASPPLLQAFAALEDRSSPILIPGAGRAYEAEALHRAGFSQVHVLDWASEALQALKDRVPDFPDAHLHEEDFFAHRANAQEGYRVLVEQTFFCAIHPDQRAAYVKKAAELLAPDGLLLGLLFQAPLNDAAAGQGPPYGGDAESYRRLFEPHFHLEHLATSPHSIRPRAGRELFVRARRR